MGADENLKNKNKPRVKGPKDKPMGNKPYIKQQNSTTWKLYKCHEFLEL